MGSKSTLFYSDKPLFGLDIGHGSVKVMQLNHSLEKPRIIGYGTASFDLNALNNGVIANPHAISTALHTLFKYHLVGEINTRRVAMALPAYRTFSRSMQLPKLKDDELREAVKLEAEQYIPMQLGDLYMDFSITRETANSLDVFVVAVPKQIVDSYLSLTSMLGLEPILIEPTVAASTRFFAKDRHSDLTSIIIDFGALSAVISIIDKTIMATSTVQAGGLSFTQAIQDRLGVTHEKAGQIKTQYGLDKSDYQKEVGEALEPVLQKIVTEIRRMLRYYEERFGSSKSIGQIVMLGGGANMPGLGSYLTNVLKLPVRTHNQPWALFESDLPPPAQPDRLMYVTAAGLGLLNPNEVFAA